MNWSVLIVDDEEATRHMLRMMLQLDGFVIHEAEGGLQALEVIESAQPDIVLLDVMMPDLDGIETCKRIRANPTTTQLPVIILSGKTHPEAISAGLEAGANLYLTKPTPRKKLVATLQTLLTSDQIA